MCQSYSKPKVGRFLRQCIIFCVLRENFQNAVLRGFIATPIDVLCSNVVKFGRQEIGIVVRYLPDKKKQNFAWLSSSRYLRIVPNI